MKQCTFNIALFAKLKFLPICMTSQFTKLTVRQIYRVYGSYVDVYLDI